MSVPPEYTRSATPTFTVGTDDHEEEELWTTAEQDHADDLPDPPLRRFQRIRHPPEQYGFS